MRSFEVCFECQIGLMNHPKLYIYECDTCGFSYEIEPSGGKITILKRGKKI